MWFVLEKKLKKLILIVSRIWGSGERNVTVLALTRVLSTVRSEAP